MPTTTEPTTSAPSTISALTTTFTPPSSCISDLWLGSTSGKTWMNLGPISHSECLPSGWHKTDYYSPGICPSGYGIAYTGLVERGDVTETAATCCPTLNGHTYVTREGKSSTISESIDCLWSPAPLTTEFTYTWTTNGSTMSTSTALSSNEHVNAYGVYIRWQESDLSSITPSTPATNTAAATTGNTAATTTASATSTSTEKPANSSSSSGLSTGAKAGIGVGVGVGGIIILALLGLFFVRRRNRAGQSKHNANGGNGAVLPSSPPSEMPTECAHELPTEYYSQETSTNMKELPVEEHVPELEGVKR
ncbi:hypothetical protein PENSTE_c006G02384 [Penicillium steckii]|uniref:Uncharacterized protein n=1 Tax=Penicillium steckii TaxID=303698 RepID=A0A1V6TG16_9EURO|nr:hypothetical protein PENSTE_c006G02384 [Penicillium steckii]